MKQFIAVLIGFMMYLIYKEYAKLVQSNRNTMLATNPMSEIVQTKEMPPPYIAPTSENVSVSITSQTINVWINIYSYSTYGTCHML